MNYKINEIFKSLQGEGANLGREVIFIRLSECNLNCLWCDTDFEKYQIMNENKILEYICNIDNNCKSIIITGGEPTLHDLTNLLELLCFNDYWIAMETNGTNDISKYRNLINYIAFSPKGKVHNSLHNADELRIVNDENCKNLVEYFKNWDIKNRFISVLDINGKVNLENTIKSLGKLNENSGVNKWRLNQQQHKILNIL